MKRSLLYLFMFAGLLSCKGPEEKVVGKWKLEEIDYSAHFESVPSEVRPLVERKMQAQFEKLKGKTFFIFHEDQVMELMAPDFMDRVKSTEGKWRMNEPGDSLFFELLDQESYLIKKLDDSQMVLVTSDLPARTLKLSKEN